MQKLPILAMIAAFVALSACVPESGTASHDAYQQHKANREAYLYQGI